MKLCVGRLVKVLLTILIFLNSPALGTVNFLSQNSRFILKNGNSQIKLNPSSVMGWRDSSIANRVYGLGLGDYNLKQYDNNLDNVITYSSVADYLQYLNWAIPAGEGVSIKQDICIDGYGGTINLGDYAQLLIDPGVTATLRNVTIKNSKSTTGCPPVECVGWGSNVTFDNVKFEMAGDFVFKNGQFFIQNDCSFTGTSMFVYLSNRPSYVNPGSTLRFDPGTSFQYNPSTTSKSLIYLQNKTSVLHFNGCAVRTTSTGMLVTNGTVIFDNNVTMTTNVLFPNYKVVAGRDNGDTVVNRIDLMPGYWTLYNLSGSSVTTGCEYSPNGRFVCFTGTGGSNDVFLSNDDGVTFHYVSFGSDTYGVGISLDSKIILASTNVSSIYKSTDMGYNFSAKTTPTTSTMYSIRFSPNGRYALAAGLYGSIMKSVDNGETWAMSNTGVSTYGSACNLHWIEFAPDNSYILAAGYTGKIYKSTDDGVTWALSNSIVGGGSITADIHSIAISPEGRYILASGPGTTLYKSTNKGNSWYLSNTGLSGAYTGISTVRFSPDGRYIVHGGSSTGIWYKSIDEGTTWFQQPMTPSSNIAPSFAISPKGIYTDSVQTQTWHEIGADAGVTLGISSMSSNDVTLKLLSGANVSVDGTLNIDNSATNTNSVIFSNDNARFVLKDWKSKIRTNLNSTQGWVGSSIIPRVSGIGLGDYNLKQYDYVPDNTFTYSEINDISMQYADWNIPANTIIHVRENIYMNGYGGTINIGENSQLFVDDSVTLTLRNVTVISAKNGVGNPAIKLASARSDLALDNVKLDLANDFYFNRGQLFVHNDVKFTGTNAFVYRSCQPSFITSGARLFFDTGTTFSVVPVTFTDCQYSTFPTTTTSKFIRFADKASQLYLNGCNLFATPTGIRITSGTLALDNKVNLKSNSIVDISTSTPASKVGATGVASGTNLSSCPWSPDGRYIAVTSDNGKRVNIFSLSNILAGVTTPYVSTPVVAGMKPSGANWSPDGKYIAFTGYSASKSLFIYSFINGALTLIQTITVAYVTPLTAAWSPDGRYIAVSSSVGNGLQIFSFNGITATSVATVSTGYSSRDVTWSPDGKFLAVGNDNSPGRLQIYSFTASTNTLSLVGAVATGNAAYQTAWSPDGRFIALIAPLVDTLEIYSFKGYGNPVIVGAAVSTGATTNPVSLSWMSNGTYIVVGCNDATNRFLQIYKFNGASSPTQVGGNITLANGGRSVNVSPDGNYISVGSNTATSLYIYKVNYANTSSVQAASNSIVLGDSSSQPLSLNTKLTSTYDVTVKLLSGANVSVDGILNIDNSSTNTNSIVFANDNARFVLKDWRSKIRMNQSSALGWRDSSIVPSVTGFGLGDYNLKYYDYVPDYTLTYSEFSNSMQYSDWNIPANTAVHIRENIYMDGYGGTINIGENAQLFVDDNVTLTLRNMTIVTSKNGVGNPAIQLASSRSALALDNVKIDASNDFYFNCGNLFVHNDVRFTGTNAFVYRSCQPSFIASGARLIFDIGTTFSCAPSTNTVCPYTVSSIYIANNFINMADKTSKIIFNGCDFKTTLTGLRLTTGEVDFDNKVNLDSRATNAMVYVPTMPVVVGKSSTGLTDPYSVHWSPDGRFLAVVNYSSASLQIFRFIGDANPLSVGSATTASNPFSVNWSPDGKYLAVANRDASGTIQVFRSVGAGNPVLVGSVAAGGAPYAANWSPDGRYIAVANYNSSSLQIYKFEAGKNPVLDGSYTIGTYPWTVSWSPDGRFLAITNYTSNSLLILRFVPGGTPVYVGFASTDGNPNALAWSPNGRYLALASLGSSTVQTFQFTGSGNPVVYSSAGTGTGSQARAASWSSDGRYVVIGTYNAGTILIFGVFGGVLGYITGTVTPVAGITSVSWSPDGKYFALVHNSGADFLQIYKCSFRVDTSTQAVSNSIVLGNSPVGSASDINLKLLSGANVEVNGILNYDNTQGYTIFASDNSRFVLKDSNSKIRIKPGTLIGWKERSILKNLTGKGLGDYNLRSYSGADKIVTFAESPGELVYNNSNAVNYMSTISRGNSTSINWLNVKIRTDSNAFAYGIRNNSNAILKLSSLSTTLENNNSKAIVYWTPITRTISNAYVSFANTNNYIKIYNSQQVYTSNTSIDALAWYKSGFYVCTDKTLTIRNPIPMSGQISLAGTLALNSDLFLDSGTTFSSLFGMGKIAGNGKSIHMTSTLAVPDNHVMRVDGNLIIEGYGNTLSLGNNAQLFVDDNVTLTLRNITISSMKNGIGNPAIKLASNRSKLVLDNSKLFLANDFCFDRGQIFVHNDVKFTGTNAFVYSSCMPSFIMSGANLIFDTETTFSFAPATYTACPYTKSVTYTSNNFINMQDATSKITFNGCDFYTTFTGLRLTTGEIDFVNKVNLRSKTSNNIPANITASTVWQASAGSGADAVSWSPDGRFVAVGDQTAQGLKIFRFTGSGNPELTGSVAAGSVPVSVTWSPDGKFLALCDFTENNVRIFSFTGSGNPTQVGLIATGSNPGSVSWSPDGKFLAAVSNNLRIFSFAGRGNPTLTGSISTGLLPVSTGWSPDGRFVAITTFSAKTLEIYSISGTGTPASVGSISTGTACNSVSWSPDGRFLAVTNYGASTMQIFRFTGSGTPIIVGSAATGATPYTVDWSPDGRFVAVANYDASTMQIFSFSGNGNPVSVGYVETGSHPYEAKWSQDGRFVAVINFTSQTLQIFTVNYINDTQTQAASNAIVFGNSSAGSASDLTVKLLSGANVLIDGILNYDNVLGGTIFSADNSKFILKDSNSKMRMNPNTVTGWNDHSLIKYETNVGLGDYNLQLYSAGDKIVTYAEAPADLIYTNSATSSDFGTKFISVNDAKFYIINGIYGSKTLNGRSMLASPIDLQGGTLTLNGDMILSSQTTIPSSGNFALNGYAMILGGALSIPSNVGMNVSSSGIIDGQGNNFEIQNLGKLSVDNNVTLTLRNINLMGHGSWPIEMRTENAVLALENVITTFDRDFTFSQGKLFIHDDVAVTGTNKFSYASTATAYVTSHAMLCFDKNTTFSYSPRLMGRHTLSERNLIKLADETSGIYFDNCTLQLPDSGWRLTNGTIYFDDRVTVNAPSTQAQSFEWGDGTAAGDVDVVLLSGASVDAGGYIYHNASN